MSKIQIRLSTSMARGTYQYLWSLPRLAISLPEGTAPVPVTCIAGAGS